ncbi:GNAT family N-acetyltransferase [uncultured Alteromonas sp.]|jgi:ElaA protein|uniref:GNAT family N-acetyltransferase n=1 Tax=uncultured Alteromonas sp. TaxID=179113 RepID=UPI0025D234C0|nr:GNAT family N-acetyltransferase [uncultured Alteromonas sp.]
MLNWYSLPFSQLTTDQLYELLKLRTDVFVVEQNCPYPELDDKDRMNGVYHLLGTTENGLVAYARLLPPGVSFPQVSIGRVVVAQQARGEGYGQLLIQKALQECQRYWPDQDIQIGAQVYLQQVYQQFGFVRNSEDYLEDGIPHVDMVLTKG